jgi:DNA-binding transcriptional ArsR family regulator
MIPAMTMDADTLIQALADGTRLRALVLLTREGSLCVCELTAALAVSQPKMSRHLAALRALDIVEDGGSPTASSIGSIRVCRTGRVA